ncbi:MAG TPA: TonB-dependent receptor [Candidatus Acidoferrum sp.]|nr:TonB-dependent receptor [Candidatus Acidoferrum sp.]
MATALFSSGSAFGQGTTGTLRGQVLDPAGAVVPNAEVTVTNQETGVSVKVTTTSAGTYALPSLIPGLYKINVEAKGFKSFVKKDVSVIANQDNVADAQVELGAATETIEVTGGAVEVQTTSSSLNNSFDARSVDLPNGGGTLNGSLLNLAVLAPNVIAQPGGVTGIGGSVGGTRPRDNNFTVDGVDDNNLGVTGNNSTVVPDAVAEFNLTTNQFSAEYGHSAGGQFSLVTKTGTNNWHGSGEWYNQNRNYNSLDNLTKGAILAGTLPGQPAFDNNRFGGTVGGPIVKNKLFVFGAYEYTYLHGQGAPTAFTAPTSAGLATLQANAADSAISALLNNFPVAPANDAGTVTIHTGGINSATTADVPIGNITIFSPVFQREHDAIVNADYTMGRHQFGARFLLNQENFILPVNSTQAIFNQAEPIHNRKIALTDAWTISGTLVNDLRLQYSFFGEQTINPCSTCPQDITINDLLGGVTVGPGDFTSQKQSTYQISDTLSWSRGKHTFKFGGQYNHFIYPQFFLPRSNSDNEYNTADAFINDVLPDNPGRTLRNAGTGSFLGTQSLFAGFAQDDFKFSPRLTLNLGIRYEYWTNPVGSSTQTLNAISNVPGVITFGNPKTDKNNFGPRVGFAYDPTGRGKMSIRGGFGMAYDVKFQNFASITLPPQLQSELDTNSACTLVPQPGWCTTPNNAGFLQLGGLPQTYTPPTGRAGARALTTSYIDDTVMPKILTWSLGVQRELARNTTVEVRYLGTRGISLPVQDRRNHESGFDFGLAPLPEYFRSQDVPTTVTASAPTRAPWDAFIKCTPVTPPATPAPCNNVYFPFGFTANVTSDPPFGSSIYHAGSVNFTQRARHGLTFNANYTYSHTLDNSTNEFFTSLLNPRRGQDTQQIHEDWGNSDLDVRHKAALSWSYQIPNIKSDSRWAKTLVNGFSIGSVFLAQTGQPVTLQSASDANGNGDTAGDRVMFNPFGTSLAGGITTLLRVCAPAGGGNTVTGASCPAGDSTVGYLATNKATGGDSTARYVNAGLGARTNVARNSFYSPGFSVVNLSVGKEFHFTESKYLRAKVDIFNVLNHPSFGLSNGNVFSTVGTTVATTTPGYVRPNDPNFLAASTLFSGGFRSMTLGLKFVF